MTGKSGGKASGGGGLPNSGLKVRVRTAKKRTVSSTRWLERQLNDPYVAKARREGYRSRAAYKLIELDQKFRLLKPG
ncbi:MAG TPA: rRNA methyltransferase, partial [Alphaproteobacteria bacterium]|nr:rRNA methyltransferase [Alphaproteobacteria bacterium]